ncbi:GFA family protein [Pseudorhizobium halotolerans]|uniref:GFA family protein n=2 Tax=Pseudorhizobium halotolerans TaxID=1233081 RepID=A0ABM8PJU2_9HYPH|nr:GFA family protein [Pseudorhizobium halotolerans]
MAVIYSFNAGRKNMMVKKSGRCLCGTVSFVTSGPLEDLTACHCSQCRRQTGLYYTATRLKVANLRIAGEDGVRWYRASAQARRGFCATCGSALFWKEDDADDISVLAGAFDQPSSLTMGCHIFCDDKADFYDLPDDGRPRYPGSRGD